MDVHILTKVWNQMMDDWDTHMGPHGDVHVFACNYVKGVEQTQGVRWTCIHALMLVDILMYI